MGKYIFFLIFLSLSCKDGNVDDLIGHWHLERLEGRYDLFEFNPFLDFENDSIVSVGSIYGPFTGVIGRYNRKGRTIQFEDFHRGLNHSFSLGLESKNKIKIVCTDKGESKRVYQAKKCDSLCCDKEVHLFSRIAVDLSLPIKSDQGHYLNRYEKSLEFPIYIGIPKEKYQSEFGKEYQFVFFDKISCIDQLNVSENNFKEKIPSSKINRIKRIIYADKNAPIEMLYELVDFYRKSNQKNLFLVLKNIDSNKGINTCLQKINDSISGNYQTIGDWLIANSN